MTTKLPLTLSLAAVIALAGCTAGGGTQEGGTQAPAQDQGGGTAGQQTAVEVVSGDSADTVIRTSGTDFATSSAQVSAGDVVTFTNTDNWEHTVTIKVEGIDKQLSGGESVTLKFNEAGSYTVVCTIHSDMTTEIGVGQSPETGTSGGSSGGSGGGGYDYDY